MNKHMKSIGITMAALGSLATSSLLYAHQGPGGMDTPERQGPRFERGPEAGMHGHGRMMHLLKELNLSEEQRQQLHDLMESKRSQMVILKRAQRAGGKALREAAIAEPYDAARVKALAEEQGRMMADMLLDRLETERQMRALLTPAQQAELDDRRAKRDCRGRDD